MGGGAGQERVASDSSIPSPLPPGGAPDAARGRAFWLALLLGVALGRLILEARPPAPPTEVVEIVAPRSWGLEDDPFRRSPRELRLLPGIGVQRANAVAQERWSRGDEPFAWSDVPGIGPTTEARVQAALEGGEQGP